VTDVQPEDQAGPDSPGSREPATSATSGIDLARSLLANARKDARVRTTAATERRAVRSGDVAGQRRSGAGGDDRDPQLLGRNVERLVSERGWEAELSAGGVVARWASVVGPEVAQHCQPDRVQGTELFVRADSSAWASELRALSPVLVGRLNEACGQGTVTRLIVDGPGAPSWRRGRFQVPGRGPRDTFG
jgi:predicted nucleic acid-binding Zn ribbon protein